MRLRTFTYVAALSALTLAGIAGAADGRDGFLEPRQEFIKVERVVQPDYPHRLTVKFRDAVLARATDLGAVTSVSAADLTHIQMLAARHGITFRQLINLPDETLIYLEQRAEAHSGIAQPDLAGMMIVDGPADVDLQQVADDLHASALTEWVYFQELLPPPPCDDITPDTPLYYPAQQGYHGPNPGLNMTAAWGMGSTRGAGIRVADCEYDYNENHEDLCNITDEPGQTPGGLWEDHGTAVQGELVSLDNGYGCTGLVPDAESWFFSEYTVEEGSRRVTAITNAIATMGIGDVVLLEMQTFGGGGGYVPAEFDPAVWTVCRNGTDAGVIVVAAAGNGDQNLDAAAYNEYMSRGDSGAIIVGAGTSNTNHDKLSFSTYGSRVNVQGWGGQVFTLAYGDYARHGNDYNQEYTAAFSGTSSASPFVTSCCIALQSLAVEQLGRRLDPYELRDILITTGIPQGSGGHIGPFPDMEAAASTILADRMTLVVGDLVGGRDGDFDVSGATPNTSHYLVYSLRGTGSTYVAQLDVTLGLASPKLGADGTSDGTGNVHWTLGVPNAASGRTIWFQSAEYGRTSNVVETAVK
ncbi:MAG: hypothetical protein D8M59_05965 [Planctomycetes bacterium]|nr:hypothetical protein [Planctomycetota bacterium]NOG55870.1 S8 family serine peptidase [Planctomycetota bacterium]